MFFQLRAPQFIEPVLHSAAMPLPPARVDCKQIRWDMGHWFASNLFGNVEILWCFQNMNWLKSGEPPPKSCRISQTSSNNMKSSLHDARSNVGKHSLTHLPPIKYCRAPHRLLSAQSFAEGNLDDSFQHIPPSTLWPRLVLRPSATGFRDPPQGKVMRHPVAAVLITEGQLSSVHPEARSYQPSAGPPWVFHIVSKNIQVSFLEKHMLNSMLMSTRVPHCWMYKTLLPILIWLFVWGKLIAVAVAFLNSHLNSKQSRLSRPPHKSSIHHR